MKACARCGHGPGCHWYEENGRPGCEAKVGPEKWAWCDCPGFRTLAVQVAITDLGEAIRWDREDCGAPSATDHLRGPGEALLAALEGEA